jgi:hypothetical protein
MIGSLYTFLDDLKSKKPNVRANARHAMAIIDMRTQACVHDVRVRLTDGLLQSSEEFGASTMN